MKPPQGMELIVGLPSLREADSIGYVVEQVDRGLAEHFPDHRALIVNADNDSDDDTKGAFLGTETRTPKHYVSTPPGVRGKGNNFFNLFQLGRSQGDSLKALVVVDADLKSITPRWIGDLMGPILEGYDYALPLYSRHQFDGTITNHLCYPLIYALLGHNLRQPIGGDFGFSPRLMHHWLDQEWTDTTRQYGIDIFMTGNALTGGFKVCQVGLGAKIHKASAPKLGPMFVQVVGTLFGLLLEQREHWGDIGDLEPQSAPRFGLAEMEEPQELKIDIRALKDQLRDEYAPRRELLGELLDPYTHTRLETMFEQDYYDVDILMWTQSLYRLIHAYATRTDIEKREVIDALRPLYFARSVAYDYLTWRYSVRYAEAAVLQQAKAFASQKPFLYGLFWDQSRSVNA